MVHIPGSRNVLADLLSRTSAVQTEWELDRESFIWIQGLGVDLEIDLFATRINHLLSLFISPFPDPLALDIDAPSLYLEQMEGNLPVPTYQVFIEGPDIPVSLQR